MIAAAISAANAKNAVTLETPSIRSPISLAKPMTWILSFGPAPSAGRSYRARSFSSSTLESWW